MAINNLKTIKLSRLIFNMKGVPLTQRTQAMQYLGLLALVLVAIWLFQQDLIFDLESKPLNFFIAPVFLTFLFLFWISTNRLNHKIFSQNTQRRIIPNKDKLAWIFIISQYSCIFILHYSTLGQLNNDYILAVLLTIISPQLLMFSGAIAISFILLNTSLYIVMEDDASTLVMGIYFIIQQLTIWGFSQSATIEISAKNDLKILNSKLTATQQILSQTSRINERLRIGRDLHDQMGHNLMGLSINLQASTLKLGSKAPEEIKQAERITKNMLHEVRQIVDELRAEEPEDFISSISTMVEGIPRLQVKLNISENVSINQHKIADCLLRCIQESITNILKHSSANQVTIALITEQKMIKMEITDNGYHPVNIKPGNGIKGMRERVAQMMGRLHCQYIDKVGVRILIELPKNYDN
jgi:signal transduction histidine kinase